jgi:transposase
MSGIRFTDEFKRDAVTQVVERGYAVSEVSERLGISTKSLYTWRAQFSQPRKQINATSEQAAEIRRLKRELARVSEERDILKKATARGPSGYCAAMSREVTSPGMQSEVRVYRRASPVVFGSRDVSLPVPASEWFLCMG